MTALESQSPPSVPGGQVWPLSRPDYRTLGELGLIPENTELLYGTVYHKMAKSPLHSFLLTQLLERLRPLLPPNHLLRSEQPIVCSDSEPEPNISVVPGAARDFLDDHSHHAEFGVEICVSSPDYDRAKLRAYASAGIPEVWLVLAAEAKVEVYRRPNQDSFAEHEVAGPGGRIRSSALPNFELALDSFFPGTAPRA